MPEQYIIYRGQGGWYTVRFGTIFLRILIPLLIMMVLYMPTCLAIDYADQEEQPGQAEPLAQTEQLGEVEQITRTERFNMSYVYFGNSSVYTKLVEDTKGSLDDISPSYFDLEEDGTLKITTAMDRGFIVNMHEQGVRVTPFLSNHWDREKGITALNNREELASQIADVIVEYDLDGVNVDIENVTENERDSYVDFVRLLRARLSSEKSVSVAVAVNPYGITKGWQASYDYSALAKHCDYLMLMAYDEHYQGYVRNQGSDAGPVAGYKFVEDSIKAALQEVPADKLVLGIPFYGRLWERGASYGGYGISNYMVEELIKEYNGKVIFDYVTKSPKAVIVIGVADKEPVIFGKRLEAGTYDIWFENEASIKHKLELVTENNLKGTGSWSLGQETKSTWNYYSMWLNSIYFIDIQNHWAKASILTALDQGLMNGMSNTQWMPDMPMTRAQAATLLVRALDIDTSAMDNDKSVFVDTAGHWADTEIKAAWLYGLVEGIEGGKFAPEAALTREQMAVMLNRIMKLEQQQDKLFEDVSAENSSWSFEAINAMTEAGLLEGFPDGTFRPKDTMSRGQVATLMVRSLPYLRESFDVQIVQEKIGER